MLKFQLLVPSFPPPSAQELTLLLDSRHKENFVSSMFMILGTLFLLQVSSTPWAWLREQWTHSLDVSK